MKKLGIICLLSLLVISLSLCRKDVNGPEEEQEEDEEIFDPEIPKPDENVFNVPLKDLVALTAVFNETDKVGNFVEKLVLLDYNDPANYKIVKLLVDPDDYFKYYREDNPSVYEIVTMDQTITAYAPKFSPDKTKILLGDQIRHAMDAGPHLFLYNIIEETGKLLFRDDIMWPLYGNGISTVWNNDNTGFYFTRLPAPFTFEQAVFYYDFFSKIPEFVYRSRYFAVYPEALISPDTLMVFSNDSLVTGQSPGFYFMDTNGNYLSRLNNPHLLGRSRSGMLIKASGIDWNSRLRLLVYAEAIQTSHITFKISVTNLDGTYYINYTLGEYDNDVHPVWGSDGKTILFERNKFNTIYEMGDPRNSNIMIINIQSGNVIRFIDPRNINGAVGLRFPDY